MGPASFTMKKLGHALMTTELRFLRDILHIRPPFLTMRLVTSGKPTTFQNTSANQIAGNNTVSKNACLHMEE